MEHCGLVLAIPEHRLSFELIGLEHSYKKRFEDAQAVQTLQRWLENYTRDIVDESDEVFHIRHQVYLEQFDLYSEYCSWSIQWGLNVLSLVVLCDGKLLKLF